MAGILDSIAGGVGNVLKPISPALDFLGLGAGQPGQDPQSIWQAIGQGAKNAAMAGPAGLLAGGSALVQGFNQMSARDRLLFGGLLLAGGVGAARELHSAWTDNLVPDRLLTPSGLSEMEGIGLKTNYQEMSDAAMQLAKSKPGIRARQASILASGDGASAGRALARTAEPGGVAGIGGVVDTYAASHPNGMGGALSDFARTDHAVDHRLLGGPANKSFRDLYNKFTSGDPLTDDETVQLLQGVKAIGDATNAIPSDDLTVGLTGKVAGIDLTPDGAVLHISFKAPEVGDLWNDENYRAKALTTLNVRAYAGEGKKNFRYLWDLGMQDTENRANGLPGVLPSPLERGPQWYFEEHDNIAKAFGVDPKVDSPELRRAIAVTSILSESQRWEKNIELAKKMSDTVYDRKDVLNPDFQSWLQDKTFADYRQKDTLREYTGKRAKQNEKLFTKIHSDLTNAGFTVKDTDVKKILRLAVEHPDDVFLGSGADKQKNFYLNLALPDLEYPVTVDMHQFDAFYGLDSGTKDRPVGDSIGAGVNNYAVIADTVRGLADEISSETGNKVLPHQVQAVIWETWRSLKQAHNGGWNTGGAKISAPDPFRIKPAGGENPVFLALQGKGMDEVPASLFGSETSSIPVATLKPGDRNFDAIVTPGGDAVYASDITPYTDRIARHLYPAVVGSDGVPRWAETRPQWVDDPSHLRSTVLDDPWAHVETFDARQLAGSVGGYPGHFPQDTILFDGPPVLSTKSWLGRNKPVPIGGVQVDKVALDHTPVYSTAIDSVDQAEDLLKTHAWAVVDDPKAVNALRRQGFDPIPLNDKQGWIAFGVDGDTAKKAGAGNLFTNSGEVPQNQLKATAGDVLDVMKNNPDGFTFNLQNGELASSGKAVAELGGELRIQPDQLDEQTIQDYIDKHRAWLSRPGMHLGGWYNSADGTYSLDVTRVHPSDTPTADVMHHMDVNKQEAAFNLDNFEEIRNPKWETYDLTDRNRPNQSVSFDVPGEHGGTVQVQLNLDTAEPELQRATTNATKHVLVLDRSELPYLDNIAKDIEQRGGANLQVHTTRTDMGDGWSPARAHTYTDGNQLKVALGRDNTVGPTNSVPLWVRSNSNLMEGPKEYSAIKPSPDGGAVVNNSVKLVGATKLKAGKWSVDSTAWTMTAGEGPVTHSGSKWTIDVGDQSDIVDMVRQSEVLRAAGVAPENIEIKTADGRYSLQKAVNPTVKDTVGRKVQWGGQPVTRNRNVSDSDVMVGQFRISPRFKVRQGGKMVDAALSPEHVSSIQRAMETFLEKHEQAAEVWRFPGVQVDSDDVNALAFVDWSPGSPMHLTKQLWSSPAVAKNIASQVDSHYFADYGDDPVAGLIGHELGHVYHGGLALQQGWRKDPQISQALRKLMKKYGDAGISKGLSQYAATNEHEFAAEAVANVLFGTTKSKIAQEAYDIMNQQFEDAFKYRGLLWKTA